MKASVAKRNLDVQLFCIFLFPCRLEFYRCAPEWLLPFTRNTLLLPRLRYTPALLPWVLPISSSAHLIIFRDLFGIGKDVITENMDLTFDVALHLGTSLAILVFFFKDFWNMFIKGVTKGPKDKEGKMMWYIIAATIPAALVGVLFEDTIDENIRDKFWLIAVALIVMGIIIYIVDKKMARTRNLEKMTLKDAIIIGCSQIFALIPGFSRSGTTIAAARGLKLDREDAAKFSFYLAEPVVLGAVVLQLIKIDFSIIADNLAIFGVGILVSFVVGLICIKYLLKYLKKNSFNVFMWYRVAFGLFVLGYLLIK